MDLKNTNFQSEKPSQEDLYGGHGHSNAADAIYQVIVNNPNVDIIGLEGDLGAGKSTVIELLKKRLDAKCFNFVTFDVDTYHHLSIKTALIKVLRDELKAIIPESERSQKILDNAADKALGNTLQYTKSTDSQLRWVIVFFVFSLLLSARYLKDGILNIFRTIEAWFFPSVTYEISIQSTIVTLLGFAPLIVLGGKKLLDIRAKKDGLDSHNVSIGDMLKRNSVDKITERLKVTREVSSVELGEALSEFARAIPEERTVILVIDNLDRVESRLVKEIWSDLNILSSLSCKNLRVLVPFSELHIASALSDDGEENISSGLEYISKRLPVVFRAPPIVSAGWREQFYVYWQETLGELPGKQPVAELIDIWSGTTKPVTPRLLKKVVNDIASIIGSCPTNDLHGAACASYLLAYKQNRDSIELKDLLSDVAENHDLPDKFSHRIVATHKILRRIVGDDEAWSSQLASIHYQTTPKIAQSELLLRPIEEAISYYDEEEIIELSSRMGFEVYFPRCIEKNDPVDAYILLKNVNSLESELASNLVRRWLPEINSFSKLYEGKLEYSDSYVEAVSELQSSGYEVDLTRLKKAQSELVQKIRKKDDKTSELLEQLHKYNRLRGEVSRLIKSPSAELFVKHLWPKRMSYSHWPIKELSANLKLRKAMIELAVDDYEDISNVELLEWLSSVSRLGEIDFHNEDSPSYNLSVPQNEFIEKYPYVLPYDSRWGDNSLSQILFTELVNSEADLEEMEEPGKAIAMVFAHSIAIGLWTNVTYRARNNQNLSQQAWVILKPYLDEYPEYQNYLPDFLTFIDKLGVIIEALEDSDTQAYLAPSVKELIKNERVHMFPISEIVGGKYDALAQLFEHSERNILIGWLKSFLMKPKYHSSKWTSQLLTDVIDSGDEELHKMLLEEFDNEGLDKGYWETELQKPCSYVETIVDWLVKKDYKLKNNLGLVLVLKSIASPSADLSLFNDSSKVLYLISLLDEKVISNLKVKLTAVLGQQSLSNEQRIRIISCFGSIIELPKATEHSTRCTYITLLEEANSEVLYWLDSQNWHLSIWPDDEVLELKNTLGKITEHELVGIHKQLERFISAKSAS